MDVGFLTRSTSRDAGGIFEVECALARELSQRGCSVRAFGAHDGQSNSDAKSWEPVKPCTFPYYGDNSYRYSPQLKRAFMVESFEICHLHSLWSFTSSIASKWANETGQPLLVSPNGMLDPWALKNSAWKKKLISALIEKKMLSRAACLQANTNKDVADYRNFGLTNPIATIPNGVYVPELGELPPLQERFCLSERKRVVYLGRIHRKKGLANMIHAWSRSRDDAEAYGWQFVIAGRDEGGHLSELKQICREHDLRVGEGLVDEQAEVLFNGPTYGKEKFDLLTQTHLFVLPSFSEGLPMAVLEAWAHQTPVMMTPECNLGIGFEVGAAVSIAPNPESIQEGLRSVFNRSSDELSTMGRFGYDLVNSQFVWASVAQQMHKLYEWMLGGGACPDFVTLDA
ncbi:glycosyltransferase [Novipirellula caenicola]|uniref:D-inositol-3-phosphate glycosyltransferase n=1 Tax=Novipirellula caenicola TaxID=1536901 RepID=A0ABP9W257_9BACT